MILTDGNIKQFIDRRRCFKQTTIAVVVNNGKAWVGSNWCHYPQPMCPRSGLATGEGYDLCHEICEQHAHAEVDACMKAHTNARGGTLYLIGHTYCCSRCNDVMKIYGISRIVIGEYPEEDVDIQL